MSVEIEMNGWDYDDSEWMGRGAEGRAARHRMKFIEGRDDDDFGMGDADSAKGGQRRGRGANRRRDLEDRLESRRLKRDLDDYYDSF